MTGAGQTSEHGSGGTDAGSAGSDQGNSIRDQVAEGFATVKDEVSSFAEAAQARAGEVFEDKKETVTTGVHSFADAIRHAADELSRNDQTFVAKLVKQAADGLEDLSRSLSDTNPEALLGKARDLGRSNPAVLLAASVLAGVAIGRFARSSASDETSPQPPRQGDGATQQPTEAAVSTPDLEPWVSDPSARSSSPIQTPLEPADPTPASALGDKPYETGWGENPPPGEVSGDTQRRDI